MDCALTHIERVYDVCNQHCNSRFDFATSIQNQIHTKSIHSIAVHTKGKKNNNKINVYAYKKEREKEAQSRIWVVLPYY